MKRADRATDLDRSPKSQSHEKRLECPDEARRILGGASARMRERFAGKLVACEAHGEE